MEKKHTYSLQVKWTGNRGTGTTGYSDYDRSHVISIDGKMDLQCSADPAFRGDNTKHNPEEMLLAALSSCHMLWYLHLCADAGIVVVDYSDFASGLMIEKQGGGGKFISVTLNPVVTITDDMKIDLANALHAEANKKCFIANSCNFPVIHQPKCLLAD